MKKIIECIRNYFSDLNSNFSFSKIFCISIILSTILLMVDYNNYPTNWLKKYPTNFSLIIIFSLAFIFVIIVFNSGILKSLKMKILTAWDIAVSTLLFSSMIYLPFMYIIKINAIYKFWGILIIVVFSVFTISIRIGYCGCNCFESDNNQSNLFDFKEIYENKFERINNLPILISEDSVNYDLLNRKFTINHIISSIESCSSEKSYVIGLEGVWGSGKTTIINNVKTIIEQNKNYIIIDDFDPWLYGNQESLLAAMFNLILKHAGIKFDLAQAKSMASALVDIVAENHKSGSFIRAITNNMNNSELCDIKNKISSYLKNENKKIIFLIDNLDRANENNIIFMFKLISIVFDLPRIIYILSYDKNRIENVFKNTLEIDPKYIEKIIQQEISVPQIQENHLENLYQTCMNNILKKYGIDNKELNEYEFIFKFLCNNIKDIRSFKRIINSVFSAVFCFDTILYKRDLLAIEIIRFCNPALYAKIYSNRQFFITFDKMFDSELYSHTFNHNTFNTEGKNFFKILFEENKEYIEILVELFPYAKKANRHYDLINRYESNDEEYKTVFKKSQISSVKYFDLYFSYGNNEFLFVGKDVDETINKLNSTESAIEIFDILKLKFKNLPDYMHREWFEKFQICFNELKECIRCDVLIGLFNCLKSIDNTHTFLIVNAQIRAIYIIATNICNLNINSIKKFIENPQNNISSLYFMDFIISVITKSINENLNPQKNMIVELLENSINENCQQIINKNINIYEDDYFYKGNIWAIQKRINKEKFDKYIEGITSCANIYRMIADSTGSSTGTNNRQYISKDSFDLLFSDKTNIEKRIREASPKNEKEQFIVDLFDNYISSSSEYEKGIIVQEFVDFNTL